MTTIRVAKRDRFTTLPRPLINDASLSFKARGILVWLLDKPDDWRCDSEQIAEAGIEGRDAVRSALRELERAGYIRREKTRTSTGRWLPITVVFDEASGAGKPVPGLTSTNGVEPQVAPATEIPASDFQAPITKDCVPKTVTKTVGARSRSLPRGSDFVAWYTAYPKHVARGDAEKAWRSLSSELPSIETLILATKSYANSREVERGFVKLPATWLRAKCWLDEHEERQAVSEW